MSSTAVKILYKGYQLLTLEEKKEIFNLIKEAQGEERMEKLFSGIEVEHMTPKEKWVLKVAKDLRENPVYLAP